jgi:predicted small secreted protein
VHVNREEEAIMRKIVLVMSVLMVTMGMSACNTMKGVGKDIERGGEKMQGAATNVQQGGSSSGSSGEQKSGDQK